MKRSLGPVALTALGIGAIIGAGIFAAIGTAIAGDSGHLGAGSAIVLSIALAGVTSAFAAITYSEFAALIPIAGSAYTYAYATLGELVAWVIGWDLILEYAVGNVAVAVGWAGYFDSFLRLIGITLPRWMVTDTWSALSNPSLLALCLLAAALIFVPSSATGPSFTSPAARQSCSTSKNSLPNASPWSSRNWLIVVKCGC